MAEPYEVDVQQVMERIREAIRRRRSLEETLGRPAVSVNGSGTSDFGRLQAVGDLRNMTLTSHRALLGPVILAIKKTLLKLLTPMLEQQAAYNDAAVRAMADTDNRMQAMDWRHDQAFAKSQERIDADVSELRAQLRDGIARLRAEVFGQLVKDADTRHAALRQELAKDVDARHTALRQELAKDADARHAALRQELLDLRQAFAGSQERIDADVSELRAQLRDCVARLGAEEDGVTRLRAEVFSQLVNDADARHAALRQELLDIRGELTAQLAAQVESTRRADRQLSASERKWRRLVHLLETGALPNARSDAGTPTVRPVLPPAGLEPDFDYAGFEERFRGLEADIKERQRIYLPYFEDARSVLDIGCGRGEFLELLRERGIAGQGVDLELDMVLLCRDKGLDVLHEDAFAHLAARADDTVGGIFGAQLIEHLDPPRIIELVKLAHRKLAPGACLVLETPNPACLMVFADSFYRDFSHLRPIHADTMRFLLEATGFREVEVKALAPVDPALRVPPIQGEDPTLASFNQGIERINALLFGFQDYAVIGRKGRASGPDA